MLYHISHIYICNISKVKNRLFCFLLPLQQVIPHDPYSDVWIYSTILSQSNHHTVSGKGPQLLREDDF